MAKLQEKKIETNDLCEYLEKESDFSFEMKVLNRLIDLGFVCAHGGTYADPITSKIREFDIRAWYKSETKHLSLAVECKNIKENFPLIASLIPRREGENFHDFVSFNKDSPHGKSLSASEKFRKQNSALYPEGKLVAKKVEQVGRTSDGKVVANDSNTFDKLTQAVNSSFDLVKNTCLRRGEDFTDFICPLLVIPDERLWCVEYSNRGDQLGDPRKTNNCSLYLDQSWEIQNGLTTTSVTLSHLDIVTYSYIEEYFNKAFHQFENILP